MKNVGVSNLDINANGLFNFTYTWFGTFDNVDDIDCESKEFDFAYNNKGPFGKLLIDIKNNGRFVVIKNLAQSPELGDSYSFVSVTKDNFEYVHRINKAVVEILQNPNYKMEVKDFIELHEARMKAPHVILGPHFEDFLTRSANEIFESGDASVIEEFEKYNRQRNNIHPGLKCINKPIERNSVNDSSKKFGDTMAPCLEDLGPGKAKFEPTKGAIDVTVLKEDGQKVVVQCTTKSDTTVVINHLDLLTEKVKASVIMLTNFWSNGVYGRYSWYKGLSNEQKTIDGAMAVLSTVDKELAKKGVPITRDGGSISANCKNSITISMADLVVRESKASSASLGDMDVLSGDLQDHLVDINSATTFSVVKDSHSGFNVKIKKTVDLDVMVKAKSPHQGEGLFPFIKKFFFEKTQ